METIDPKAPFSIATTPWCREGLHSFLWIASFTLEPYLIMLSVKQEGIKYHFLSLWHDSTRDLTLVCRAIGEHRAIGLMSRVFANGQGDWGLIQGRIIPKTQKIVL